MSPKTKILVGIAVAALVVCAAVGVAIGLKQREPAQPTLSPFAFAELSQRCLAMGGIPKPDYDRNDPTQVFKLSCDLSQKPKGQGSIIVVCSEGTCFQVGNDTYTPERCAELVDALKKKFLVDPPPSKPDAVVCRDI